MAIDIAAKLAALREAKAKERMEAEAAVAAKTEAAVEVQKEINTVAIADSAPVVETPIAVVIDAAKAVVQSNPLAKLGTSTTSEIDHLEFMSKMSALKDALLGQHPQMPVLLMQIHKHLRADPELVGTLSEEEIGDIVNSLKVQTKTELTGTILKQSKSRDKKTKLDADMF